MKIAFFLGSVDISGGSYVIYQHALYAHRQGHDVTIVAQYVYQPHQLTWHSATRELTIVHVDQLDPMHEFDLAVATWWKTATELHRLKAQQYAYFVQSIESRFYGEGEVPLRGLVDSTYRLPLPGVTEATWIQEYLATHYGHAYQLARNGIRKDLYREDGPAAVPRLPRGELRVLVEGPFGVFFKNVGRSLKLMRKARPSETWLLTSSEVSWYPNVDRLFSRVPIERVAEIYRSCDVIVKLSYVEGMFGPPLEMFHCGGTAVVYDVTGHDEYIVDQRNALVVARDDEQGVVDAVQRLQENPDLLASLKQGARETADAWPDWDTSSREFLEVLTAFMDAPRVNRSAIESLNRSAMDAYAASDRERLAQTPGIKWRYRLDAMLDRVPRPLARNLRLGRYVLESLR
ncbi:glycosyltransferase family 4 protein [Cupriavidus pauculus]|uniref:glycosyltransferase family 4 protein n=1 Tax=Cupriavidus pauculus TaxID=82633 RepID=UPI001D0C5F40|nr:glycosyltransferase family 4 protein [Cupriavidus pauculus]